MNGNQLSLIVAGAVVCALAVAASLLGIDLETLMGALETTQELSE